MLGNVTDGPEPAFLGWKGVSSRGSWMVGPTMLFGGEVSGQTENAKALRQKKLSELNHSFGRRAQRWPLPILLWG